ncbi:MAG: aminotransferase class III-fold pyridoxal phosphate-dependent enzyme, partial [Flavobacteriaceae bacterium]|nr:aminotransferase class III-fold pyridoxal phosphate-dependent enzyme [Flavobacteriaceae bacterium]
HSCLEAGMALVDRQSVGAYAAFIAEPVLSAAGIIDLPTDYLKKLKKLCEERGLLLILDEAQTAFGRVGLNFAFERDGILPDFLTLSKTLGGGIPLAATVTSSAIEEDCYKKGFLNITSHISDPLPAHVGLAMIAVLQKEKMAERAVEQGDYLMQQLSELQQKYECIGDVRGRGLLIGVEIVKDRESREPAPELGHSISEYCLQNGLSMNIVRVKGMGGVFRIAPPLNVSREEIDLGIAIMDTSIAQALENSRD